MAKAVSVCGKQQLHRFSSNCHDIFSFFLLAPERTSTTAHLFVPGDETTPGSDLGLSRPLDLPTAAPDHVSAATLAGCLGGGGVGDDNLSLTNFD